MSDRTEVPISKIRRRERQVRTKRDVEKQLRLNESVKLHSVLQPLLVKPVEDWFDLLAGEGRLIAAIAAGMETVPVRIWNGPAVPGLDTVLRVVENDIRSELSDADMLSAVMDITASNSDWQKREIARQLSLDPTVVSKMFTVNENLIPAARKVFMSGAFRLGIAYEIALEAPAVQHEMLAARLNGGRRDELKTISRKARNTTVSKKVSRIRCAMQGGTLQISGKDIDLESACEIALAWVKRAKKAIEAGWDAKTLERACKQEAGAA